MRTAATCPASARLDREQARHYSAKTSSAEATVTARRNHRSSAARSAQASTCARALGLSLGSAIEIDENEDRRERSARGSSVTKCYVRLVQRLALVVLIELMPGCATRDAASAEAAVSAEGKAEAATSQAAATAEPVDTAIAPPVPSVPAAVEASAEPAVAVRASVRFLCDEKYVSSDPCNESAWMMEVVRTPATGSLLAHEGPGPEGAIWNGNAPMVVIVPESTRSVSFGPSPLHGTKALGLAWFRVPTAVWRGALVQRGKQPYRIAPVHIDGKLAGEIWFAEGE